MNKTYNINLAGVVFTMDEDAYNLLNDYLDTLQHAFRHEEESREIVKDIEARAAELLLEMLGENRQVVSLSDIETVINRIGRPEEMIEEEEIAEETSSAGVEEEIRIENMGTTPPPINPQKPVQRKLFRDPQGAMIGGVCAGLAAYLRVDVTWVRLLTVALSLLSFSTAAIVYLILWIVLPEARTPLQRMQMNGEAPTMANIGRTVTDTFRGEQQGEYQPADTPDNRTGFKRFLDNLVQIFGVVAKILLVCCVIVGFPVIIALAAGLLGCLFTIILFSTSWGMGLWQEISVSEGINLYCSPIIALIAAIGYILIVGIPLGSLIWMVIFKSRPIGKWWKRALAIIWGVGFILAAVFTGILNVQSKYHNRNDSHNNVEITTESIINTDLEDLDEDDFNEIQEVFSGKGVRIIKDVSEHGRIKEVTIVKGNDTILKIDKANDLDSAKMEVTVKSRFNDR